MTSSAITPDILLEPPTPDFPVGNSLRGLTALPTSIEHASLSSAMSQAEDDSTSEAAVEALAPPTPVAYVNGVGESTAAPLSVRILATLAVAATLVLAADILMPITISLLLALTLRPTMRRCRKWGLPDTLSALVLLGGLVIVSLVGLTRVVEPAREWMTSAPSHMQSIRAKLETLRQHWAPLAATTVSVRELTTPATGEVVIPVEMKESSLAQHLTLASSTGHALGNFLMVLVLTFFVLVSGDRMLNQILSSLPRLSAKKRTVQLVREVEHGVAKYLSTVTLINAGLGIATGLGLWLLGMPNPALWGAMVFLFNYVPFFGPFVCTLILILVSLLTFDSLAYACVPPLFFIAISAVEGNLLTPMIIGRSMSLNPILVFVALMVGGWAWGLGGAILAIPLLAAAKIATSIFNSTRSVSNLLAG